MRGAWSSRSVPPAPTPSMELRAGIRPSGPFEEPRRAGFDGARSHQRPRPRCRRLLRRRRGCRRGDAGHVRHPRRGIAREPHREAVRRRLRDGRLVGHPGRDGVAGPASLEVGEQDRLLLHGGSGAVGQAAIQIARSRGAEVVATAGRTTSSDCASWVPSRCRTAEVWSTGCARPRPRATRSRSTVQAPTRRSRPASSWSTAPGSARSCRARSTTRWGCTRGSAARRAAHHRTEGAA